VCSFQRTTNHPNQVTPLNGRVSIALSRRMLPPAACQWVGPDRLFERPQKAELSGRHGLSAHRPVVNPACPPTRKTALSPSRRRLRSFSTSDRFLFLLGPSGRHPLVVRLLSLPALADRSIFAGLGHVPRLRPDLAAFPSRLIVALRRHPIFLVVNHGARQSACRRLRSLPPMAPWSVHRPGAFKARCRTSPPSIISCDLPALRPFRSAEYFGPARSSVTIEEIGLFPPNFAPAGLRLVLAPNSTL